MSIVIILGRNDGILDLSGSQAYEYMATFRMYIEDVWGMNESYVKWSITIHLCIKNIFLYVIEFYCYQKQNYKEYLTSE